MNGVLVFIFRILFIVQEVSMGAMCSSGISVDMIPSVKSATVKKVSRPPKEI